MFMLNDLNKEIRIDSEFLFINKLLKKMMSREKKFENFLKKMSIFAFDLSK